jgi:Holliday junction resolvase-like predicted endonuclease
LAPLKNTSKKTNCASTSKLATSGEKFVKLILEQQNWTIVATNLRRPGFELDLVACKGQTLAVIEVKTRRRRIATLAESSLLLPYGKSQALRRGVAYLIESNWIPSHVKTIRIDLALVTGQPQSFCFEYFANAVVI